MAEPITESRRPSIESLPEAHTQFVLSVSPGGPTLLVLLLVLLLLVVALLAALIAARYRTILIAVGVGALALALGGVAVLQLGPRDSLFRDPILPNILVGIGLALLFGTGVLLGVLARMAWQRLGAATRRRAV